MRSNVFYNTNNMKTIVTDITFFLVIIILKLRNKYLEIMI